MNNGLMTTKELCEYLRVSRMSIERFRKRGMPYKTIGTRSIRFNLEEVLKWLEENKKEE